MIFFLPTKKLTMQSFLICMTICVMTVVLAFLPDFLTKPNIPPAPTVYEIDSLQAVKHEPSMCSIENSIACGLGDYYHNLGRDEEALCWYRQANKIEESAQAYNQIVLLDPKIDSETALKFLDRAIQLEPHNESSYNLRGWVKTSDRNEHCSAINDLNYAISLNSEYGMPYIVRGSVYLRYQYYDQAIADLSRGITLCPQACSGYVYRAMAHQALGNHREAVKDFSSNIKKLIEQDRFDSSEDYIYRLRGESKFYLGDFNGAIADFAKSIELNNSNIFEIPDKLFSNELAACYYRFKRKFYGYPMYVNAEKS